MEQTRYKAGDWIGLQTHAFEWICRTCADDGFHFADAAPELTFPDTCTARPCACCGRDIKGAAWADGWVRYKPLPPKATSPEEPAPQPKSFVTRRFAVLAQNMMEEM